MSKYIDVDALSIGKANRDVFNVPEYADGFNSAIDRIMNEPAADVAPVIHAHWIRHPCLSECSNCKWLSKVTYKFCPLCGAKMELDVEVKENGRIH